MSFSIQYVLFYIIPLFYIHNTLVLISFVPNSINMNPIYLIYYYFFCKTEKGVGIWILSLGNLTLMFTFSTMLSPTLSFSRAVLCRSFFFSLVFPPANTWNSYLPILFCLLRILCEISIFIKFVLINTTTISSHSISVLTTTSLLDYRK